MTAIAPSISPLLLQSVDEPHRRVLLLPWHFSICFHPFVYREMYSSSDG
ncbi:hypothetical protein [Agathobaculum massiliense]|nr:hypothetical protein [Agathobaculum massiliense]